jgi:hypothetical protein
MDADCDEHVGFGKGLNFRSVALEPNYLAGLGYSPVRGDAGGISNLRS